MKFETLLMKCKKRILEILKLPSIIHWLVTDLYHFKFPYVFLSLCIKLEESSTDLTSWEILT